MEWIKFTRGSYPSQFPIPDKPKIGKWSIKCLKVH